MTAEGRARARRQSVTAFVVVLGLLVAYAARHPRYEWDLLGYVGVVLSGRGSEQDVMRRTYLALEQSAPEAAVRELTGSIPYRAAVASDARAFAEQLRFYSGRVGYTFPIGLLDRCGLSAVRAAFVVSLAGAVLSALVAFAWCARRAPPWNAFGLAWMILFASGWLETARLATPDALATGWLLLGAWLLVERRRRAGAALAFLLAASTRPDASIVALAVWWGALPMPSALSWRALWPYAALPVALLVLLETRGDDAGAWWTVFVHSFHGWLVFPSEAPPFALERYAATVAGHVGEWSSAPPLFVAVGVALVIFARRRGDGALTLRVALALALALVLRFPIFPALWPRLCQPHVALAGLLAVRALAATHGREREPA